MKLSRLAPSVSLIAIAAMHATATQAQTADAADLANERGVPDIIVTAQKRTESLSKTAAAISVIGQGTLDSIGARSFKDAVSSIPNVSANGLGSSISIRGLGTATLSASNGTVAYHVDGIFQNSTNQSNARLFDVARVEVLRGPQGTLYGRNATAGVVNVLTNNANLDKVEAFGDVSYGRFQSRVVRGAVNLPVSENFAVRLTGTYEKSDDFREFANGKQAPGQDAYELRLAWRAKPSDAITWDARVAYQSNDSVGQVAVPIATFDRASGRFVGSSNRRNAASLPVGVGTDGLAFLGLTGLIGSSYRGVSYREANVRPLRSIAFRSNLNFEISDRLSLTYLLGYAHDTNRPGGLGGLQPYQIRYATSSKANAWSHELNLNYDSETVNAVLGLYSFQNVARAGDSIVRIFAPTRNAQNEIVYSLPLLDSSTPSGGPDEAKTRAVFGQATVDLSESFRVTGGARYNWDDVSFATTIANRCPFGSGESGTNPNTALLGRGFGPLASVPVCTAALFGTFASFGFPASQYARNVVRPGGSASFEKFSWKATAEYDLAPDAIAYATVATGYKAGGVGDIGAVGRARFFRPETNINYEVGVRSKLFDNTLSLNLTGFWTDYEDLQIQSTSDSNPGLLFSTNLGKSRSRGVELEYLWAPTSADVVNGYLSYLDTKIINFPGADPLTGEVRNFRGNRLPGAPEFSARISYAHTFDLGSAGRITPTATFLYQAKSFVLFTNSAPSRVPSFTRSDLIVRYETADRHFSLEAFVNNIENKSYVAAIFPELGAANAFFTPPRTYGVRAGVRF